MMPPPDFDLKFYYGPKAKPPRVPGQLAIATWHIGEGSAQTEIQVGRSREDIGRIEIVDRRPQWKRELSAYEAGAMARLQAEIDRPRPSK
jgi:hypothetical protein